MSADTLYLYYCLLRSRGITMSEIVASFSNDTGFNDSKTLRPLHSSPTSWSVRPLHTGLLLWWQHLLTTRDHSLTWKIMPPNSTELFETLVPTDHWSCIE